MYKVSLLEHYRIIYYRELERNLKEGLIFDKASRKANMYAVKFNYKLWLDKESKLNYPLCSRCQYFYNDYSSIFGDAWTCSKDLDWVNVDDNNWHFEQKEKLYGCQAFRYGEPTINVLG